MFTQQNKANYLLVVALIILVLLASSATYLWQQSVIEKMKQSNEQQKNDLQQKINDLQNQLDQATAEKNTSEQKNQQSVETEQSQRYLKIISPNGGEALCLDENYVIKWDSKGIGAVEVSFQRVAGDRVSNYFIGTFPSTYNESGIPGKGELDWKVGNFEVGATSRASLEEYLGLGFYYQIWIKGADTGSWIGDYSDSSFSIDNCKG